MPGRERKKDDMFGPGKETQRKHISNLYFSSVNWNPDKGEVDVKEEKSDGTEPIW